MDRNCKTDSYKDIRSNRMYRIWCGMKTRCNNPKSADFRLYGGRGIKLSKKWLTFEGFRKDMEPSYKKGLTIDRIDNNGNYSKRNCRWATREEQGRNTSTNRIISYKGKTMIMKDWAKELGVKYKTLSQRINGYKWSYEKALVGEGGNYFG